MEALLRVPIIQRGAITPDACPTGHASASIPVGGAVVAENAIIPGAHSEDVCCSMYATFFKTAAGVESQLDALMAAAGWERRSSNAVKKRPKSRRPKLRPGCR